MPTLKYETVRGNIKKVRINRKVTDSILVSGNTYYRIEGDRVLASSSGNKPRFVGYFLELV